MKLKVKRLLVAELLKFHRIQEVAMRITILLLVIGVIFYISPNSLGTTPEEASLSIANQFRSRLPNRNTATSQTAFGSKGTFLRIKKADLLILESPTFQGGTKIFGITKVGEVLQFLEKKTKVEMPNFLSSAPSDSGVWFKVKMIDGTIGWLWISRDESGIPQTASFLKPATQKIAPRKTATQQKKESSPDDRLVLLVFGIVVLMIVFLAWAFRKRDKGQTKIALGGNQKLHDGYLPYGAGGGQMGYNQSLNGDASSNERNPNSVSPTPQIAHHISSAKPTEARWPFEDRGKTEVINGTIRDSFLGVKAGYMEPDPISFGSRDLVKGELGETRGSIERRLSGDFFVDTDGREKEIKTDLLGTKYIEDSKGNRVYFK